MELKEMIKVMQHFDNGGDVEFSNDNFKTILGESNKEDSDGDLCWDWDTFKYRIKEQKQKVTIEKWLLKDSNGDFFIIEGDKNHIEYTFRNKVKLFETYEVEL